MKFWHVLVGGVAFFLAVNAWIRYRARKLAKARAGLGFNEFAGHFSADGIPLYKLREVYVYFQNLQPVEDFPVQPDDNCCDVYSLCDEDLDDAAYELAKAWGVKFPEPTELRGMTPVRTVADLVRFLARCRPV